MLKRIVTINTWKCDGDYFNRINELVFQLSKLNPSIIACQECFLSNDKSVDTLKFISDKLEMHYDFTSGRFKERLLNHKWVTSFSNLGILSKHPIIETNTYDLPGNSEDTDRKVFHVKIELAKSKIVELFNTHLTHLVNSPLQQIQFKSLTEIINANKNKNIQLVCGDFNADINSKLMADFIQSCKAQDCYDLGNGIEPRYSLVDEYHKNNLVCVDHIFVLPNIENNISIIDSHISLDDNRNEFNIFPSDHFGISTVLSV